MAFDRITDGDLQGKGNIGRPDTPGVDTAEMQRILDELPREVIVPAFNRLAGQLEAPSAAASLGAVVPQGLPAETPATVQGTLQALYTSTTEGFSGAGSALAAHTGRTDNPHAVTAAQTGAYTKEETDAAIGQRVVDIGAGDMTRAVYDPGSLGRDATTQLYVHTKSGTVHNFAGSGANGRAKLTANVAAGDTFTVNGTPVTAYMGAESAADSMAGGAWSGKWVSFVFDGKILNFKGGGGTVTVSGLSAAAVKTGVTVAVKQGTKTVQAVTGTFTSDGNIYDAAVLENHVGYAKGARVVGTMPNKSATIVRIPYAGPDSNVGGYLVYGSDIWVVPAIGYYGGYNHTVRRLEIYGPELANAIGLTPNKLPAGTTVLGVAGSLTWKSLLPQVFVGQNGATVDPNVLGSAVVSRGNIEGRGVYINGHQSSAAAIFTKAIDTNTFAAVEITIGEMLGREENTNLSIGLTNVASPGSWDSGYISRQNYVSTINQGNIYRCDFPAGQSGYVKIGWTSAHGFVAQTRLIKR